MVLKWGGHHWTPEPQPVSTSTAEEKNEPRASGARCLPAMARWERPGCQAPGSQGTGRAPVSEQAEELLRDGPWSGSSLGGWWGQQALFNLVQTLLSFISLQRDRGDGGEVKSRRRPRPPHACTHSLMAELTLDKQLQSIYLRPYGVGEQVCR